MGVGVGVGTGPVVMTSWGALVVSRDRKLTPSWLDVVRRNAVDPFPATLAVTSTSTQPVFDVAGMVAARAPAAGAVFQVTPISVQPLALVRITDTAAPVSITYRRSLAVTTGPMSPEISKRSSES